MRLRNLVIGLLITTVVAPIVLYTDKVGTFKASSKREFLEDIAALSSNGDTQRLNVLPQESSTVLKEPIGVVYYDNSTKSLSGVEDSVQGRDVEMLEIKERKYTRVLSTTEDDNQSRTEDLIRQVTNATDQGSTPQTPDAPMETEIQKSEEEANDIKSVAAGNAGNVSDDEPQKEIKIEQEGSSTGHNEKKRKHVRAEKKMDPIAIPDALPDALPDARVRQLKDQVIRARVYLSLPSTKSNAHLSKELRSRIKEVVRAIGDASKDSDLPRNADDKSRSMEQTLIKGRQLQDDCAAVVKKLRAMLHSTDDQLRVHKKQTMFLKQVTAKTFPKGLHCLPLRLTAEYYALKASQQQFPNQEKLEDPLLYHFALFSDNVLATAVVVNSTVTNAKHPSKHVFHIVTDRLNYAAMRMWFLVNPPGEATIQVQNIEEFKWLNSSYSPVLKQLGSPSMIDYYFRTHRANSDSNLKFRNPKYLSILNHLRFYLPEIYPKLNKVVFLDDDIVVQKELIGLWTLDLKGNVNGAVETCGENFHRFDRYLNFSNPLISKNFDPHACGWAYGMNVFDLEEWKRQNITEVYHQWQNLNHDRQLWKLGTLPPGLITFWKRTFPLNRSWHVLGLGYNPNVNQRDIERASVIHYNGNLKPWLEIGIPRYRNYWAKYVDYNHLFLRECNINP